MATLAILAAASWQGEAQAQPADDMTACLRAIGQAEARYGVPPGLLATIGVLESGVAVPGQARTPWPWTTNAAGVGGRFATRAEAVGHVRRALALGIASIDVGCMQVNLRHHPTAFATLEDAFDPILNTDYAARFLVSLHAGEARGDWMEAAGLYHSRTPDLAATRKRQVLLALSPGTAPGTLLRPANLMPTPAGGAQDWARRTAAAALRAAGTVGADGSRLRQLLLARTLPGTR